MEVFGNTRSRLAADHALITPDTHVISPLVGWTDSSSVVHISPQMGARFLQYTATMEADATSAIPARDVQRCFYVRSGQVRLCLEESNGTNSYDLGAGGYAFLPANNQHSIVASGETVLVVFEKRFEKLDDVADPEPVVGNASDVTGDPFMGDPDARLQTLLPINAEFDMAVNIFTYQPGATLPQVEIHVMEHGLMMLSGMGVYRLSDSYYPVAEGDIIWMASFCPQWFVAMGKQPASYIYYKDIHRDGI